MGERERKRHGQRQKETEQGDESIYRSRGSSDCPRGGTLYLAGLPVCASSAGSQWVLSAFYLTMPFVHHRQHLFPFPLT